MRPSGCCVQAVGWPLRTRSTRRRFRQTSRLSARCCRLHHQRRDPRGAGRHAAGGEVHCHPHRTMVRQPRPDCRAGARPTEATGPSTGLMSGCNEMAASRAAVTPCLPAMLGRIPPIVQAVKEHKLILTGSGSACISDVPAGRGISVASSYGKASMAGNSIAEALGRLWEAVATVSSTI